MNEWIIRSRLPIDERLKLLKLEDDLIEKHRKAGSSTPVTDGVNEFMDVLKKQFKNKGTRKETSTKRVKNWRARNKDKVAIHNRNSYLKRKGVKVLTS